jgi:hypothetical protein
MVFLDIQLQQHEGRSQCILLYESRPLYVRLRKLAIANRDKSISELRGTDSQNQNVHVFADQAKNLLTIMSSSKLVGMPYLEPTHQPP